MDYLRLPVSELIRGPLVSTPQGVACIIFSLVAVTAGVLYCLLPEELASSKVLSFGLSLFLWPVLLFVLFVKHSSKDFRSSWGATGNVSLFGLLPYVAPYLREWV